MSSQARLRAPTRSTLIGPRRPQAAAQLDRPGHEGGTTQRPRPPRPSTRPQKPGKKLGSRRHMSHPSGRLPQRQLQLGRVLL